MGIGIGILLLVLGLILVTGAVDLPQSLDNAIASDTLGVIFLVIGGLAIVLALAINKQRTTSTHVTEERRIEQ